MNRRCARSLCWLAGIATLLGACDPEVQTIRIAAQDFRFDPAEVRAVADRPLRLRIVNEGREPHVFASALLSDPRVRSISDPSPEHVRRPEGITILPGRFLELTLHIPQGTYPFHCRVRGHTGMTGTLIVGEPPSS